ncbi:MAG TPA: ECF-type sigma factor [Verrucomicrobiae bacterium]|nr:ECF-type sigma factor [Verrucomicrobiae bacterium]
MSTVAVGCHSYENGLAAFLDQPTYEALLRRAAAVLRRESCGYLFEPADLVHDSFLRIARSAVPVRLRSTSHLVALATLVMRRVMVDHSRSTKSVKDGITVPLAAEGPAAPDTADTLVVRDALACLGECEGRLFRIVQMRFFGGFGINEIASTLDVSSRTVKRDWSAARERLQGLLRH